MEIITKAEAKAQGLKRYFTGKECKRGHVSERTLNGDCISCVTLRSKKHNEDNKVYIAFRQKNYNEDNKESITLRQKKYYEDNKESITLRSKRYREDNKDNIALKAKKYNEDNKEKNKLRDKRYREDNKDNIALRKKKYNEDNKVYIALRQKKYYKDNPHVRKNWQDKNPLNRFTRRSLRRICEATGKERINRAEVELGYTQEELIYHIESQFLDGMSWDNRSEWHIDHIKPVSLLIKEGVTDPAIINALSNLQPLWAKDNQSKGAKYNECA